jgi:hypothetical protein
MTPVDPEVPQVIPETELEIQRYEAALRRKQLSLVLAGKLNPQDATELKVRFFVKLFLKSKKFTSKKVFYKH